MEFIQTLTKYLYILVITGLIIVLIYFFIELSKIKKTMKPINKDVESIKNHLANIKEKEEQIEHAKDVSLPFFLKTYAILSLSKIVFKDFLNTNPQNRNLKKSVKKIYKLSKSI